MTKLVQFANQAASAYRLDVGVSAASTPLRLFSTLLLASIAWAALAPAALGQAIPAAEAAPISTGFSLPLTAGTLQYAVSVSEGLTWGYYNTSGAASYTSLSGDLAYISGSQREPFSVVLAGGRSWSTSSQASSTFDSLSMSQVVNMGRWTLVLSDSLSYAPSTSIATLSGVAGVGDLGVNPVPVGTGTGQGVLTNFSSRVSNTAALSVQRQLTGRMSINGSGTYGIIRFLGNSGTATNSGLDGSTEAGSGGINYQINARTGAGAFYSYSTFNYSGQTFGVAQSGVVSQSVEGTYSHQITRKISVGISAGPQWTTVSSPVKTTSVSLSAQASASYAGHYSNLSGSYSRSTNSGYGVVGGAISDSLSLMTSRTLARVWSTSASASYSHTSNLPVLGGSSFSFHTEVLGVQVSRAIARNLSCYASYTLENQSSQGPVAAVDVFSGLSQVVGFGLTYSPLAIHLGHQ